MANSVVEQSVLDKFRTAWRQFYANEKQRLEADKKFLEDMKISDLQTSLDGVRDLQTQLSISEANDIVASLGV